MITRTTTALLEDLSNPENRAVWEEFDARYRPILIAFGRRFGLGDADAADAAQDALARLVNALRAGKYDRSRGRLRSWMVGIAQNCVRDVLRTRAARREERGMSAVVNLPEQDELERIWDAQCQREILARAVERLAQDTKTDARTIRAFTRLVLDRREPAEVAEELEMTMNDVYLAKHRCLKKVRAIVAELEAAYEVEK